MEKEPLAEKNKLEALRNVFKQTPAAAQMEFYNRPKSPEGLPAYNLADCFITSFDAIFLHLQAAQGELDPNVYETVKMQLETMRQWVEDRAKKYSGFVDKIPEEIMIEFQEKLNALEKIIFD
ncbi:hypothetical protein KKC17_03690 [Patescibacteria group bacterium]|nr:hypothetical protein [Patescibacteria group bacterium]